MKSWELFTYLKQVKINFQFQKWWIYIFFASINSKNIIVPTKFQCEEVRIMSWTSTHWTSLHTIIFLPHYFLTWNSKWNFSQESITLFKYHIHMNVLIKLCRGGCVCEYKSFFYTMNFLYTSLNKFFAQLFCTLTYNHLCTT